MKRALFGAAVAALCLVAACDDEPRPNPSVNTYEPLPDKCEPSDRRCQYDDGEMK